MDIDSLRYKDYKKKCFALKIILYRYKTIKKNNRAFLRNNGMVENYGQFSKDKTVDKKNYPGKH